MLLNPYRFGGGGGGGGGTDPYFANVVLLLQMTGTNASTTFTDKSASAHSVTAAGNAQVTTGDSPFGGGSLELDGAGDYLSVASSTDFDFGTGDGTIEMWLNMASGPAGGAYYPLVSNQNNFETVGVHLYMDTNRQPISYLSGDSQSLVSSGAVATGGWHHLAWTVAGGKNAAFYIDGSPANSRSGTNLSIANSTRPLLIGSAEPFFIASMYYAGLIGPLRITKGIARYTASFTAPTGLFPES